MTRPDVYAGISHPRKKSIDNLHCILRNGEHALVRLGQKADASRFEPAADIGIGKFLEQTLHQAMAARIDGFQAAHLSEGIGKVAAAAAGHRHFRKKLCTSLIDGHVNVRIQFLDIYCRETACRSTADYCHFQHGAKIPIIKFSSNCAVNNV